MTDNTQAAAKAKADKDEAARIEANSGLKAPTAAQKADAQQEGALEAVKEAAKDTYKHLTDGSLPGEPSNANPYHGKDEIMQWAHLVDLDLEALEEAIDPKVDHPIPEEKVAGLLSLERSGKNRTDFVKLYCKRLGVKSPYEVTNAGPGYTNDVTAVTKVER